MLKELVPLLLVAAAPAGAGEGQPSPYEANKAVLAKATNGASLFALGEDGKLTHIQSGLVCASQLQHYSLETIMIFNTSAPSDDVGCDYSRRSADGAIISKLTVFFVKGDASSTLDGAFAHYREEVLRSFPDATATPSNLHIKDSSGSDNPAYKSSGFSISVNGEPYHSELIVGFVAPWVVEVRATYKSDSIHVDMSKGKDAAFEDALRQRSDITNPYIAFMASNALGASPGAH